MQLESTIHVILPPFEEYGGTPQNYRRLQLGVAIRNCVIATQPHEFQDAVNDVVYAIERVLADNKEQEHD